MAKWADDPKLDAYIVKPLLIMSLALLGIALQFDDKTANSYVWIALIALIGYIGAHTPQLGKMFRWAGLGRQKDLGNGVIIGTGLFAVMYVLGGVLSVPFAIGTSVVLNALYRWISAFFLEEACFRSFLYPTFKMWTGGNKLAGAVLSSMAWSYFHIVALSGDPALVISIMFIGVVFAMANEYAKSSMPSYMAHNLWNASKVLF